MKSAIRLLPVFIAFYCMGFVDIVGTAVKLASEDFALSPATSQFLTFMIFIWFLIFSIPTGILQDRIGKKKVVLISLFITTLGMILPFTIYNYGILIASFTLLGIGNTVLQVSLNPLLYDISQKGAYSSNMSLSQFIKAIAGFFGPLLAVFFAKNFGDWKLILLFYGVLSVVSSLWLFFTPITETKRVEKSASFKACLRLLGNNYVLTMVIGIFIVVGLDIGMNTGIPGIVEKYGLSTDQAVKSISIYIFALMASRFSGALILKKVPASTFLLFSSLLTLASLVLLIFSFNPLMAKLAIALVGFGSANIFPLIFSMSVEKMPERSNEISALMIMAISGGAVFPFLMGTIIEKVNITAGIVFLLVIASYLGGISIWNVGRR